jgi:hypothetical protein
MSFFTRRRVFWAFFALVYWLVFWNLPPEPPLVPSRETTFFTGPLDDRGFVDFSAAMNARCPPVPIGQNAVLPLLRIAGPECWPWPAHQASFVQLLGEPLPASDTALFVPITAIASQYFVDHRWDNPVGTPPHEICRFRPWSPQEFPVIASWVIANEPALKEMEHVASCSGFFWPRVPIAKGEWLVSQKHLFHNSFVLLSIRVLAIRAMQATHHGDLTTAVKDLATACRVARLLLGSEYGIQELMGTMGLQGSLAAYIPVINHASFSAEVGRRILADLALLDPVPDGAKTFEATWVINQLCLVTLIARDGENPGPSKGPLLLPGIGKPDFNAFARVGNEIGTTMTDWMKENSVLARLKAAKVAQEAVSKFQAELWDTNLLLWRICKAYVLTHRWGKRAAASKLMAGIVFSFNEPRLCREYGFFAASREMAALLRLAVTLRLWRCQKGTYPETLDEIHSSSSCPIIDSFSERPYRYRREGDGCVLYSVGPDLDDDGGAGGFPGDRDGGDIVIHLL